MSYGYSCERYYINTKRWHMKTFIKVICKIRFNWTHFEMSWNSIKEVQILHFFNKTLSRPNIPVHGLSILSHLASLNMWNSLSGSTEHSSIIHLQMKKITITLITIVHLPVTQSIRHTFLTKYFCQLYKK